MKTTKSTLEKGMGSLCADFFGHVKGIVAGTLIIIFLLCSVTPSSAQEIPGKISPDLLKRDFSIFRDSLEKLHGGLYRYKDKKQIDRLFERCGARLDTPMTLLSFYALTRLVISGIEDEHTSSFLPPEVNRALIARAKLFPLMLRFIGHKAFITCDTKGLAAGTAVTTIDHEPVDRLRKELFNYISSDGSTESGKYAEMNEGDSPFLYLYYLVHGEKSAFTIGFTGPDGKKGNIQLPAEVFQNVGCHVVPVKVTQYLNLTFQPGGPATLTIKSFLNEKLQQTGENLADFLRKAFAELAKKQTRKLIIDVRDNGGGQDENGALLISYLTNQPFTYYASIQTTTKKFEVKDHDQLAVQQPHENNFKGPVYVLMNGKCVSGTSDFCGIAAKLPHIKFIGEETGGGYYGNTSGARKTLILPHTGIKVNIPLWEYFNAVRPAKYKDRGVIPDYLLSPTINDIIQHQDVQMDLALHLANKE